MKMIMYESMPRWYGLSWDAEKTAIRIRLNRELPRPEKVWDIGNTDIIVQHGFHLFESDLDGKWFGFDRALEIVKRPSGEYREFIGKLPQVRIQARRKCFSCEGKGEYHGGEKCFSCDGTGKEYDLKWRRAEALAMSIGILLDPFEYNEQETHSEDHQLLTVYLFIVEGDAPIWGMIGIPLHHWVHQHPQYTEFTDCVDAMKQAYGRMMGESRVKSSSPFDFRARVYSSNNHHIAFDCPGDACGVYGGPDDDPGDNKGYPLSSHNVDSAIQQLTLLAGLAALHDRADREIKEKRQEKTA